MLKDYELEYIDGIMITDNQGRILYSIRYNPRFDDTMNVIDGKSILDKSILDKSILEVYPSLTPEDSTVFKCIKSGKPVFSSYQKFQNYLGQAIISKNLTIPIIRNGKTVGTVELTKDITTIEDIKEGVKEDKVNSNDNNIEPLIKEFYDFGDIKTQNVEMMEIIEKAQLASKSHSSVLIYGETGTGKELFVQSIHQNSLRKKNPFIAQNCAALPESLFESILFGTAKGAYTGALDRKGLFELANEGTIFLDEINSMPLQLQAKLLRVLQDGKVRRIGGQNDIKVDVRIIAAMNVSPYEAIKHKIIREDFFYRISVFTINIKPLRERKDDVTLLTDYFLDKKNKELSKTVEGLTSEVSDLFQTYSWPGNVRELEHVIEGAINLAQKDVIELKHLPAHLCEICIEKEDFSQSESITSLTQALDTVERQMVRRALIKADGNITKAARSLDIPRQTLRYKIKKHEL